MQAKGGFNTKNLYTIACRLLNYCDGCPPASATESEKHRFAAKVAEWEREDYEESVAKGTPQPLPFETAGPPVDCGCGRCVAKAARKAAEETK